MLSSMAKSFCACDLSRQSSLLLIVKQYLGLGMFVEIQSEDESKHLLLNTHHIPFHSHCWCSIYIKRNRKQVTHWWWFKNKVFAVVIPHVIKFISNVHIDWYRVFFEKLSNIFFIFISRKRNCIFKKVFVKIVINKFLVKVVIV